MCMGSIAGLWLVQNIFSPVIFCDCDEERGLKLPYSQVLLGSIFGSFSFLLEVPVSFGSLYC